MTLFKHVIEIVSQRQHMIGEVFGVLDGDQSVLEIDAVPCELDSFRFSQAGE